MRSVNENRFFLITFAHYLDGVETEENAAGTYQALIMKKFGLNYLRNAAVFAHP